MTRTVREKLCVAVASGLGIGFVPVAPGTFGSLWGLLLAWAVGHLELPAARAAVIAVLCIAGVPIATVAARALGGKKDPGAIVLDEIVAVPIAFFLVPLTSLSVALVGFVLWRVMDIVKPPPARQLERLPKGLGIMADDWAAAAYACLALHLLRSLGAFAMLAQASLTAAPKVL